MKLNLVKRLGIVAIVAVGAVAATGCSKKTDSIPAEKAGVAERTGAALDKAADKTVTTTKEFSEQAVEKTGEVLEKAGAAVEKTGSDMQK